MFERCDCCSREIGDGGVWIQDHGRTFKFCSHICMSTYDLLAGAA